MNRLPTPDFIFRIDWGGNAGQPTSIGTVQNRPVTFLRRPDETASGAAPIRPGQLQEHRLKIQPEAHTTPGP